MNVRTRWWWLAAGGLFVLAAGSLFIPLPRADLAPWTVQSLRVVDRHGIVLREFPNDQEGRGTWMPVDSIAPSMLEATIAVEDRRFFLHPGVDPLALVRATAGNLLALRFKSGGSTLTQQVIRNVYHRPRTILSKLVEMWDALRLERMSSKRQILEQYLNRSPYGNQLFGVEAAARWYFGKPAHDLSLAESAYLAGLPNAPSILNPQKNAGRALDRQRAILRRMLEQRRITGEDFERAMDQPIQLVPPEAHFRAPHVAEMVEQLLGSAPPGTVVTTIDYPLQQQVQWAMRNHLAKLKPKNVHNAAAIVLDNASGEIRALVGSADFFDSTNHGQVNGVLARRQPGSAIKPFMYALALERNYTPASLLPDVPTALPDHHGDYVPDNYDRRFHGPVRLRSALACSYNVPAVRTLQALGKPMLLDKLRDLGFSALDKDAEFYGYGLTLGNAEVSLLELSTAYMALANCGLWRPATLLPSTPRPMRRVYEEQAVFLLTDILRDPVARRPAFGANFHFPFPCAVKTGTTKDYKDNWTVGYTTRYTVGVWVGNFDGKEMHGVSGVSGAGPILTDIMMFLHLPPYGQPPPDFMVPSGIVTRRVCVRSGLLPTRNCQRTIEERFIAGHAPVDSCTIHRAFLVHDPDGRERRRVFEIFPPEFHQWASSEGIPSPPPGAVPADRTGRRSSDRATLMILSPNAGDYFKIDPVLRPEYQVIRITGFIPAGYSDVHLTINGVDSSPFDPHGKEWKLEKGVFRFQLTALARGQRVASSPVVITVD